MKLLVGVPDHSPGGFHWTEQGEMLVLGKLVCRSPGCGCDRSWSGQRTTKSSTLAKVVEPPLCFNLKPELAEDIFVVDSLRIAETFPVGTLLRARYNWQRGPSPQDLIIHDPRAFLEAWDITIAGGPN